MALQTGEHQVAQLPHSEGGREDCRSHETCSAMVARSVEDHPRQVGIVTHEEPYYNSCALWTTMNMIYSDSAQSIADIIGKPLAEIPAEQMVKAVHSLALDKLKDSDHRFHIRPYFGL